MERKSSVILFVLCTMVIMLITSCETGSAISDSLQDNSDNMAAENESSLNEGTFSSTLTPTPTLIPTPTNVPCVSPPAINDEAAIDAYRSVLKNEIPYMNTYDQEETYLFPVSTTVYGTASQFAVVDLEQNGTPEVIVKMIMGEGNEIGSEILCYQEGVVYGTRMQIKQFNSLKSDGIFLASSGASNWSLCQISMNKLEYKIIEIASIEAHSDIYAANISTDYTINSENVTKEIFDDFCRSYEESDNPTWYDITEANISSVLVPCLLQ